MPGETLELVQTISGGWGGGGGNRKKEKEERVFTLLPIKCTDPEHEHTEIISSGRCVKELLYCF